MATAVLMPRAGQSVETCLIVKWRKQAGEAVKAGEVLCEVETDKAVVEVEAPEAGTLLAIFCPEGEYAPVMTNIAALGRPGENVDALRPEGAASEPKPDGAAAPTGAAAGSAGSAAGAMAAPAASPGTFGGNPLEAPAEVAVKAFADGSSLAGGQAGVSPRARHLAASQGLSVANLSGSGPGGRIIERDVQAALAEGQPLSPLAKSALGPGLTAPAEGSGIGGRVLARDLAASTAGGANGSSGANGLSGAAPGGAAFGEAQGPETEEIVLKGIRKLISDRMLASLQTTAQLTLNASADARALQAYRARLKESPDAELQGITLNDLVLFAVARLLPAFPELNAHMTGDRIIRYKPVHLGFAVDTPRGLMVPVIRRANALSLRALARESKRLSKACLDGQVSPDELGGGTFTVTNLGSLGIESFTPVLNIPQVAILGVGAIALKAVGTPEKVSHVPHLGLSLTLNHQVVDGSPAARFVQGLSRALAGFDLLLAG